MISRLFDSLTVARLELPVFAAFFGLFGLFAFIGKAVAAPLEGPAVHLYQADVINENGQWRMTFEKSCGASLYGIVAIEKVEEKGRVLELAVAMRHGSIDCLGGLETHTMQLPMLDGKFYKEIRSMEIERPTPGVLGTVYQLSYSYPRLSAIGESRCGTFLGTVLRPTGSGPLLEVGFIHSARPTRKQRLACRSMTRVRSILSLSPEWAKKARPSREKAAFLRRQYSVVTTEITGTSPQGYRYLRRCNEAPIGLGQSLVHRGNFKIVLARYPNVPCPENTPRIIEDTLSTFKLGLMGEQKALVFHGEGGARKGVLPKFGPESAKAWTMVALVKEHKEVRKGVQRFWFAQQCQRKAFKSVSAENDQEKMLVWALDQRKERAIGLLVPETCSPDSRAAAGRLGSLEISWSGSSPLNPLRLKTAGL